MSDKVVNPWVRPRVKLAEERSSPARYVIEVDPGTLEHVQSELSKISDIKLIRTSANMFIVAIIPSEMMSQVLGISGVKKVSADTLAWIKDLSFFLSERFDPWIGKVGLSQVEIACGPFDVPLMAPLKAAEQTGDIIYTTSHVRKFLGIPDDNTISTKVAVLDTGLFWPHPLMRKQVSLFSYTEEPALDGQGHGTWCGTAAFGDGAPHPLHGLCEGLVNAVDQMHGKVLSNMGFGMTSQILDGMYAAVKTFGARVVSMSLGGPLQGSAIDDDPMCRLITSLKDDAIFVVAAGNEGPSEWTIGSPGACPDALTIGSWGMTRDDVAGFSSRGPSAEHYKENHESWVHDKEIAGDNMIKPDCVCPGGDDLAQEKLLAGCAGWYGPIADVVPGFGAMMGTSMATPHAAALVALAVDRGYIQTADDVKRKIAKGVKSIDYGYGLLTWESLSR